MLTENWISEFLKQIRKETAGSWLASVSDGVGRKKMAKKPHQFQTGQVAFTGVDLVSWSISRNLGLEALTQGKTEHVQVSSKLQTHAPRSWILSLLLFQSCTKTNCMLVCDAAWIQWKKFHLAFELHWDVDFQKWFKTPSWQTPQFYRFIWFPHYPHFFIPIWLWNEGKKSSETCWAHVFKYSS